MLDTHIDIWYHLITNIVFVYSRRYYSTHFVFVSSECHEFFIRVFA